VFCLVTLTCLVLTLTTASLPTMCALLPTPTALPLSSATRSQFSISLPRSEKREAPSASAKTMYAPRAWRIPWVTAPPFPLFCSKEMTRILPWGMVVETVSTLGADFDRVLGPVLEVQGPAGVGGCVESWWERANDSAVSMVWSVEPSDMMRISQPLGLTLTTDEQSSGCGKVDCRYSTASSSMPLIRCSSLYAGTTTVTRTSASPGLKASLVAIFPLRACALRDTCLSNQHGCVSGLLIDPSGRMVMYCFSESCGERGTGATMNNPRYN